MSENERNLMERAHVLGQHALALRNLGEDGGAVGRAHLETQAVRAKKAREKGIKAPKGRATGQGLKRNGWEGGGEIHLGSSMSSQKKTRGAGHQDRGRFGGDLATEKQGRSTMGFHYGGRL
eukprot:1070682-Pleurochrysis_carterae.AAC.1